MLLISIGAYFRTGNDAFPTELPKYMYMNYLLDNIDFLTMAHMIVKIPCVV